MSDGKSETTHVMQGLLDCADVGSAFIAGVVAKVYDQPRVVPPIYDDAEAIDWLRGYDA